MLQDIFTLQQSPTPKAKIVFSFAGTGDEGEQYAENEDITGRYGNDVIRIYFRGCHHENIGGGAIFPDLEIAAEKIRTAFNKDKILDLGVLHKEFGDAIVAINGPQDYRQVEITDIALKGFSRGGVTTFAVAKKLDELDIPMDIVANQPVPGQNKEETPASLFSKYHNLKQCKNIRSATTFLASHNMENDVLHNHFFQQMVAKFPPSTEQNVWLMPHQEHNESVHYSVVDLNSRALLTEKGYSKPILTLEKDKEDYCWRLEKIYANRKVCFTPQEFRQKI